MIIGPAKKKKKGRRKGAESVLKPSLAWGEGYRRNTLVKHRCRFVAQGFRRIKGRHYKTLCTPTLTAASVFMALVTAAVMDIELLHINLEQAYLFANVDTEIFIKLPEEY